MGLWGQAALGAGLAKVGSGYMRGQRAKQLEETQELQNKMMEAQLRKAEAESEGAAQNLDIEMAINETNSLSTGMGQSIENNKKETSEPPKTPSPTGMGGEPAAKTSGPNGEVDESSKYIPLDGEDRTIVQPEEQNAVNPAFTQKEKWQKTYEDNMNSASMFSQKKKAEQQNKSKNLIPGSPGYNKDADLEVPDFTSPSGSLEWLNKTVGKIELVEEKVNKRIEFLKQKAQQTGNKFYLAEAYKVYQKYGKAISESKNNKYLEAFKFSVDQKDEAAVNTLASIIGLTGNKSQTFDYNEDTKEWDVLNGGGSKAYSTSELSLALTDKNAFSKLQSEIRKDVRESNLSIQKAIDIYRGTGGSIREWQRQNLLLGQNLVPVKTASGKLERPQMFIDRKDLFGAGGGPVFFSYSEVKKLKDGTSDLFLRDEAGRLLGYSDKETPDGNKKRMIKNASGNYVWVDTDDFKNGQFRNYNPESLRTTITQYTVDDGRRTKSDSDDTGNPPQ